MWIITEFNSDLTNKYSMHNTGISPKLVFYRHDNKIGIPALRFTQEEEEIVKYLEKILCRKLKFIDVVV